MTTKIMGWRRPEDLKPHPLQNVIVTDVDDATLARLRADLARNGQLQPVEITADDTTIDGHQRVRAAIQLGWERIDVWIRDDLADDAAVEKRFLEANLNRRQMSKLEMARAYVALKDNEQRQRRMQKHGDACQHTPLLEARGDLRDKLASIFGCSGRTLDRYACVLNTPIEVQQAFERGELKLEEAGRVSHYSKAKQLKVAESIRAGEDAKKAVAKHTPPRSRWRHRRVSGKGPLWRLKEAISKLRLKDTEIRQGLSTSDLPELQGARDYVINLIEHIEQNSEACKNPLENAIEQASELPRPRSMAARRKRSAAA